MAEIYQWRGFRELEQNLKLLGNELGTRGVRYMMSHAAVPMRDEARRLAPVLKSPDPRRRPGTIRQNIKIWRKSGTRYAATYYVGVRGLSGRAVRMFKQLNARRGKAARGSDNPSDPFYWRFQELGTSRRARQAFLAPAFDAKKTESVSIALDAGRDFVRRTAARLKRTRK